LIGENGAPVYADRLGTNRGSGARFYPFGDEITSTSNDRTKFGTYSRDSFTGLDYADQRFYASSYGRFNTADQYMALANGANDPSTPHSWNKYAYVLGDPINHTDRHGLFLDAEQCIGDPEACEAEDWGSDGGAGYAADPTSPASDSAAPNCNPTGNAIIQNKINFISINYAGAVSVAADVQTDMGTTINTSALTVMFLQWGFWESGTGTNPRNNAQNNIFGAQQGATGSIPCSAAVVAITGPSTNACFASGSFATQLTDGLDSVPHTPTNKNPDGYSYEDYLEAAINAAPSNPGAWLQAIATKGWNTKDKSYGSRITKGVTMFPQLIKCLGLH
jgi:RHS repeat-associated protein